MKAKMNENNQRLLIFSILGLIWGASILLIMTPSIGLTVPVFPKPRPDFELAIMLVSGALLVGYSIKTGISYLRPN